MREVSNIDKVKVPVRSHIWWRNVRRLSGVFSFVGFDPRRFVRSVRGIPRFIGDAFTYSLKHPPSNFKVRFLDLFPLLNECSQGAGAAGGHYFHQDLWAARKIFKRLPANHVDIGSRIDGFVAHLLTFMPVTVIDIRAMEADIDGLNFIQDDATLFSTFADESIDSLSTLHAAEHFGLGRYLDPIEPDACSRFMESLQRVLRPGGRLYFSVPIGRERVDFNAHRVLACVTVLEAFSKLSLISFSFVDDAGDLHEDDDPAAIPELEYGCGLFEFTKLKDSIDTPFGCIEQGDVQNG
jgi:SAM-dependent methyltransferase